MTLHPTIQFLQALGKTSVFIRSWVGKGYEAVPNLYRGEPGRAYNVRCDRTEASENPMEWAQKDWDRLVKELERQNSPEIKVGKTFPYQSGGWCPYLVVNNGGHKQAEIVDCPALFIEFDAPITKDEAYLKLQSFPFAPSIVIESRAGLHLYWLLDKPTSPKLWRQMQWRLIEAMESDAGIEDPSRCMRLPGFYHLKEGAEPFLIEMNVCNPETRYSLEDFDRVLPEVPKWRLKLETESKPYERIKNDTGEEFDIRNFKHALNHYKENARREWDTCQCPVHASGAGHSHDSLHINSLTGAFHCWNGCSAKDIYKEIVSLTGWKRHNDDYRPTTTAPIDKPANEVKDRPATVKELNDKEIGDVDKIEARYRQLREEVMVVLQSPDIASREFSLTQLCTKYRMPRLSLEKIVKSLEEVRKPETRKTRWTWGELQTRERETVSYLIEDWIPLSESILLSALPKVGKSLLAYEACYAVATGTHFLGRFRAKKGNVLIIQTEEGTDEVQKRLDSRGFDSVPGENIRIWEAFKWHNQDDRADLAETLATFRPKLVMVDSLRRIQAGSGLDENKAEFANAVYEMSELCRQYGAALIVIHHDNKSQDAQGIAAIAGTSALSGAVWGSWRLLRTSQNENDPNRMISCTVRGENGGRHNVALIEEEACQWSWNYSGEVNVDPIVHQHEQAILRALANNKHKPLSFADVSELSGFGRQDRTLYRPMNRLIKRGRVKVVRDDKNKKLWWYSLPNTLSPQSSVQVCNLDAEPVSGVQVSGVQMGSVQVDQEVDGNYQLGDDSISSRSTNTYVQKFNNDPLEGDDEWDGSDESSVQQVLEKTCTRATPVSSRLHTSPVDQGGESVQPFVERNGRIEYRQNAKPVGKELPLTGAAQSEVKLAWGVLKVGDRVFWGKKPLRHHGVGGFQVEKIVGAYARLFGVHQNVPVAELYPWKVSGFAVGETAAVSVDHFDIQTQKEIEKTGECPALGKAGTVTGWRSSEVEPSFLFAFVEVDGETFVVDSDYLRKI